MFIVVCMVRGKALGGQGRLLWLIVGDSPFLVIGDSCQAP